MVDIVHQQQVASLQSKTQQKRNVTSERHQNMVSDKEYPLTPSFSKYKYKLQNFLSDVRLVKEKEHLVRKEITSILEKHKTADIAHQQQVASLQSKIQEHDDTHERLQNMVTALNCEVSMMREKEKNLRLELDMLLQSRSSLVEELKVSNYHLERKLQDKERLQGVLTEKLNRHSAMFDEIESATVSIKNILNETKTLFHSREDDLEKVKNEMVRLYDCEKLLIDQIHSLEGKLKDSMRLLSLKENLVLSLEEKVEALQQGNRINSSKVEDVRKTKDGVIAQLVAEKEALAEQLQGMTGAMEKFHEAFLRQEEISEKLHTQLLRYQREENEVDEGSTSPNWMKNFLQKPEEYAEENTGMSLALLLGHGNCGFDMGEEMACNFKDKITTSTSTNEASQCCEMQLVVQPTEAPVLKVNQGMSVMSGLQAEQAKEAEPDEDFIPKNQTEYILSADPLLPMEDAPSLLSPEINCCNLTMEKGYEKIVYAEAVPKLKDDSIGRSNTLPEVTEQVDGSGASHEHAMKSFPKERGLPENMTMETEEATVVISTDFSGHPFKIDVQHGSPPKERTRPEERAEESKHYVDDKDGGHNLNNLDDHLGSNQNGSCEERHDEKSFVTVDDTMLISKTGENSSPNEHGEGSDLLEESNAMQHMECIPSEKQDPFFNSEFEASDSRENDVIELSNSLGPDNLKEPLLEVAQFEQNTNARSLCSCNNPPYGYMVKCANCDKEFHAACISWQDPSPGYVCNDCTKKPNGKRRRVLLENRPEDYAVTVIEGRDCPHSESLTNGKPSNII